MKNTRYCVWISWNNCSLNLWINLIFCSSNIWLISTFSPNESKRWKQHQLKNKQTNEKKSNYMIYFGIAIFGVKLGIFDDLLRLLSPTISHQCTIFQIKTFHYHKAAINKIRKDSTILRWILCILMMRSCHGYTEYAETFMQKRR